MVPSTVSAELVGAGKDLYLMFKHEESPEGALHAEMVLRKAGGPFTAETLLTEVLRWPKARHRWRKRSARTS